MDNPQASTDTVYEPAADRVFAACKKFDEQNGVMEQALTELFGRFPRNDTNSHVLLKVAALNALYHANILALEDVLVTSMNAAERLTLRWRSVRLKSSTPLPSLRLAQPGRSVETIPLPASIAVGTSRPHIPFGTPA
jgi:hypothetical protein